MRKEHKEIVVTALKLSFWAMITAFGMLGIVCIGSDLLRSVL